MRHDGPKELFGELCAEVCYDVKVEPDLLPLTGEQFDHKTAKVAPDARSDVRVRGFFTKEQNAFFEFRIVYPFASSYLKLAPAELYDHVAHLRKMEYEQRINQVDNGSFTPMIILSTGGMGAEMTIAMKHLARKLADKRKESYPAVATLLRCSMAFNVARSSLVCVDLADDMSNRSWRSWIQKTSWCKNCTCDSGSLSDHHALHLLFHSLIILPASYLSCMMLPCK